MIESNELDIDPSWHVSQKREILYRPQRGDDLDGYAFGRKPRAVSPRHRMINAARRAAGHHQMAWWQWPCIVPATAKTPATISARGR